MCLSGRTAPSTSHFIILSRFFWQEDFLRYYRIYVTVSTSKWLLSFKKNTYVFFPIYVCVSQKRHICIILKIRSTKNTP